MAQNSRTHIKHGSDYTKFHFYKLMSFMSVSESDNQIEQLKLMKDRIDRAFQDLVTEIEGNISKVDDKVDVTDSTDFDTAPF